MYFPLIVILSLTVPICMVSGQVDTYDEQHPLTFVYTIYPFFNSETLLQVWKNDDVVNTATNVETSLSTGQENAILYSDNTTQHNETDSKTSGGGQYLQNQIGNINGEELSKNKQRLSNYRNRHKNSNLQNE